MPITYNPSQGLRQAVTSRLSPEEEHQLALDRAGPFDRGWRSAGLAEEGSALADEALKAGIRGDVAERERLRGLSQAKLQEAASWAPEVKTTADIDGVQSGLQWAAGGLGSGLRSTLPSATGGLAGATAALLTRGRVSPVVGGMFGGGYPAYAMEQEEAAGEALHDPRVVQRNTDEEILRASRLKGAITALPEVALPAIVGGKVVGQGAKALTGGTPLRHIGAQTLKGGAVEGGTEYAQALVGQATQNELRGDPLTDFDQRAALEEAAVGALVGKTLGVAGGVADVGHHKLVKPAVNAGKEIKKDPLGKVVDTIVDTGGKLGTVASKAKHGIEDYLDEREARKAGMSYEELMLSRMPDINPAGKSQEQLEAELQADDAQRMAAASVLAQRLAANPDASPALRQAAADFERRTQQGDPTAYEALSGVLRDEHTKRDVREELLNNISSWLDSKGFKLPPERRGSAMTPGGEDIEAKVKQLWLQKHSHLSGAYNTTFPDDDTARISADAVFEWVKRGFPNFNAAARGLATVWGKEAPLVVKDAHDYMVAEGLTQRAERLDEVLKKLEMVAGGKMQRLKLLGELVRPSEQERMTTVDLAVMDRLLDQFALGKIKNLGSFNEHMERVFGGRKDEALALYERLNQDELIEDTGADDRRDEADADEEREAQLEGEAQDWNSGVQEKPFPTEYRGMRGENSAGYDTLYDEAKTALNDAVREARSKGEQASAVGAWDRAQRESEGDENVLKNKEDDLIAKYGGLLRSADIKQRASEKGIEADAAARELLGTALDDYAKVQGVPVDRVRDSMLRALNRRVRFVAVNAEDRIDAVDMTSADVSTLKVRYKDDSKKYGVLVFEKLAAEQQIEQVDAETGEVRKLAVMQPLKKPQEWMTTSRKLIGFIRKAKNLDAGESFGAGQQLEQLYAGISSLFETGMFSGRVGYRNEAGGEVAWIDNKAQMPVDFPLVGEVTVADAKQQKKQAVPTEKERRDEAKREGAQWVNNPPKQTAGAVGPRTVVENDEGKLRGGRNQHHNISEQEEMDAEQVRKEDAKPRTHDELTGEPLHPATRVETKEVDTTQSDYVLDLLRKGMPAFNAKMSRATAEQRAKIKALIEKMLNSMSDLKAKVWGKTPPKDAEQFARRARLALMTLEKDQDVERTSEADEDAAESVDRHYRSLMLTSKQVEELEGNRPLWAVFEDADDGALIRFIGASTNFDAAHYVAEQDKLTLVNDVAENLKRYITRLAALDERKSNAMEPEDKKAQVRQLIKEGKIEEAKAVSEGAVKQPSQTREAKPGEPGSIEKPHSVPMTYTASAAELRPALRKKYQHISRISYLIGEGQRTGTTRNPPQGVLPGHYVTFPGVPGVYRVTGFEKIDLKTPEGIAKWEEREGWSREATKARFAGQVEHGKIQMVFERVDEAKPSAQYAVVSEPLTDEQKQAIEDELVKTVNLKPVWAKLIQGTDGKPWSGDWTPDMIRIAIAAADPMGVARHESIHQFFHLLRKNGGENVKQILERLSQNGIIRKRLEELLTDHPAAIEQLSDPEEFAAYAYQFWRAERLELGPKTEGFFQRVWTALKEILGLVQKQVKDAQHAEQILQAFSEGKVAAEPDVVIQALEKDAKAHNQRMENMRVLLRDSGLHQALRKAVFTAGGTLDGYGIEALTKARKLFDTGEGDAITKQSFFEAKAQETAKRLNQLRDILNGGRRYINGEWKTTDIKPTKKDIELLSEALRARKRPNDAIVGRMYDSVQQYLKEMHAYLVGAKTARWDEEAKQWVPMGEIKDYVMPQVWDVEKIMENPQLVVDRLMEKHLPVLEKIAQEALAGGRPEEVAQAIVQRIIASAGAKDLEESTMDIGMTPYMRSVNKRTLNWIDAEAFAEFMQKDIVNILSSYTVQGVKRAEYVRRFGNGGTKLSALANEAMVEVVAGKGELPQYKAKLKALVREWVKAGREGDAPTMRDALAKEKGEEAVLKGLKHLDPAFKALMAMEGTLGYDIDPRVRQLMSGVTTYQNLRLLWLAIFSSFGDPLGIVVRGGEMKDAWNAFARGVREVRLRWKNEHSTDDLARLAEQLGTVDAGSFLDALGQTYSSVFMYGKFKTINDALFKWNGMEAWNRAMRIQATGAAVGFIKSHLTKSNEHSERYLKQELGLDPAQKGKWLTKDGELDYSRDEVKTAVMRWVDGAILRPNAAQRPVYASDPHYALFYHLKQFVYSFHKTILKRAYVEAQHGNWSPAAALVVAYVPVLIAADLAKELLLPDDDPPWMKQGFGAAVSHGFWRANLLGVPGLGLEAYRREDASSLLGPQIDQFADLVSVPFSERRTALGEGLGALPGGSVWRRMAD